MIIATKNRRYRREGSGASPSFFVYFAFFAAKSKTQELKS